MKKINIPLGSINRNNDDGSAHVFNLRLKDGAFRPVSEPSTIDVPQQVKYIHVNKDYRNLIDYVYYSDSNNTTIYYLGNLNKNLLSESTTLGDINGEIKNLNHIGNTLIVLADSGIYYFLFKNDKYTFLGDKPPIPKIKFKIEDYISADSLNSISSNASDLADNNLLSRIKNGVYFSYQATSPMTTNTISKAWAGIADSLAEAKKEIADDFNANYNKSINEITNIGGIPLFPFQLRYALRLYDGSYVYHSAPLVVANGIGNENLLYILRNFDDALKYTYFLPVKYTVGGITIPPLYLFDGKEPDFEDKRDWWETTSTDHPLYLKLKELLNASDILDWESIYKDSRLAIKFKMLLFQLMDFSISDWEDIITSIDIFITKPYSPFKLGEQPMFPNDDKNKIAYGSSSVETVYDDPVDSLVPKCARAYICHTPYENLPKYTTQEIHKEISNNGNFYLLKSISIEELKTFDHSKYHKLSNEIHELYANIEQEKTLPDDSYSRDKINATTSYVYNQALHLADIKTQLFKGFNPGDFTIIDTNGKYINNGASIISIANVIDDNDNNLGILTKTKAVSVDITGTETGFLSPMLYYPNTDAFDITVITKSSDSQYYQKTFSLQVHPALNGAYYLHPELKPLDLGTKNFFVQEDGSLGLTEKYPIKEEPNKMLVTNIANPFFFDIKRTNYIGNTAIIAMRANTLPISQGQFGDYPLYVFCEDGIYVLATNDEGAYMVSKPVTYDILLNKKALISTQNNIVFATEQGIKVLSGSETFLLSVPLNGQIQLYGDNDDFHNPKLAEYIKEYSFQDFLDYIKEPNLELHFDYPHNEIWLAKPSDKFAYIYNLDSKGWTYRTFDALNFIDDYPNLYYFKDNKLHDVTTDGDTKLPFTLITNPYGSDSFVKYRDILLNGRIKTKDFQISVFAGSNPYRTIPIRTLSINRDFTTSIPGIHIGRIPASVRYIQFALKGTADDASLIGFSANTDIENYNPTR